MKRFLWFTTPLLFITFLIISCQSNETQDVIMEDRIFSPSSSSIAILQRIGLKDGSQDNIIDGASCFDINFPYQVLLQGQQITINSTADFIEIERILDHSDSNTDALEIIYPITVTTSDYLEITIFNSNELNTLSKQCVEGGNDLDIECVDVVYPLTLFTYNANQEQIGAVDVGSDRELNLFFLGLSIDDYVELKFPVALMLYGGERVIANTDGQFVSTVERALNICDEDDDADYNDDDFTEISLVDRLLACPLQVQVLQRNMQDVSENYVAYILTFNNDGSLLARDRFGDLLSGIWSIKATIDQLSLTVDIDNETDISGVWLANDIDESHIEFYVLNSDDHILLSEACDQERQICSDSFINEQLVSCNWVVINGEGTPLNTIKFNFSNSGIVGYDSDENGIEQGLWFVKDTILNLNDLSKELSDYEGNWEVTFCSTSRFDLLRGQERIVIKKQCD